MHDLNDKSEMKWCARETDDIWENILWYQLFLKGILMLSFKSNFPYWRHTTPVCVLFHSQTLWRSSWWVSLQKMISSAHTLIALPHLDRNRLCWANTQTNRVGPAKCVLLQRACNQCRANKNNIWHLFARIGLSSPSFARAWVRCKCDNWENHTDLSVTDNQSNKWQKKWCRGLLRKKPNSKVNSFFLNMCTALRKLIQTKRSYTQRMQIYSGCC